MPNIKSHIQTPTMSADPQQAIKSLYDAFLAMKRDYDWLLSHLDNHNIQEVSADKISTGTLDLTKELTIKGDKLTTILDQYGLDVRFIKWFTNKCYNSSFECFDADALIPTYWDGGVSTSTSNWHGTYSLKLTAGESSAQTDDGRPNPQWWDDVSKMTRVSFHKKGGAVEIRIYDETETEYEIYNQTSNHGTSLTFGANTNWEPAAYSVSFSHSTHTKMRIEFTSPAGADDSYIDGVVIEPDYTRKRPSFYSDGPHSFANDKGADIMSIVQLYVQTTEPTDAVEKDVWIDTDDYSRYDRTALSGNTTLATDDDEVIDCTGTFTLTLHAGTSEGIIKKIYNTGTGIITISGTINGAANMFLYPNESVELITDGTNWRM